MYPQADGSPRDGRRSWWGKTTLYTLLFFSLAGLMAGFAIGGFASHLGRLPILGNNDDSTQVPATTSPPQISGHSPQPTATRAGPENVSVTITGIAPGDFSAVQVADGKTNYQFAVQVLNKADKTPITATDVTCRLWLTNDIQATTDGLSANDYAIPKTLSLFSQPFPSEISGALSFAASSPQTQYCSAKGKTKWSYTLASSVPPGIYYLAVLVDWKGIHYTWYLVAITVKTPD